MRTHLHTRAYEHKSFFSSWSLSLTHSGGEDFAASQGASLLSSITSFFGFVLLTLIPFKVDFFSQVFCSSKLHVDQEQAGTGFWGICKEVASWSPRQSFSLSLLVVDFSHHGLSNENKAKWCAKFFQVSKLGLFCSCFDTCDCCNQAFIIRASSKCFRLIYRNVIRMGLIMWNKFLFAKLALENWFGETLSFATMQ